MAQTVANLLVGAGTLEVDSVGVGYTDGGVSVALEKEYFDLEADQSIGILGKVKTKERCLIKTNLSEPTITNLATVWDTPKQDANTLSFGGNDTVDEVELVFSGTGPNSTTRTVTIYKAVSIESGEHSYLKNGMTMIPVTFEAIIDTSKSANVRYGSVVDA